MRIIIVLFGFLISYIGTFAQQSISNPTGDNSGYVHAITINVPGLDSSNGDFYFVDADKNEKKGELNEALILFGRAAFEYNSDKKTAKYANSVLRLSNVHYQLNHFNEAEQMILNLALKAFSKIGNRLGQMQSYGQLGKIYTATNKFTQAIWFYTQQGILAEQLRNHNARIESMLGIAQVKIKKKEFALALKDISKAEGLAKQYKISTFNSKIQHIKALAISKGSITQKN